MGTLQWVGYPSVFTSLCAYDDRSPGTPKTCVITLRLSRNVERGLWPPLVSIGALASVAHNKFLDITMVMFYMSRSVGVTHKVMYVNIKHVKRQVKWIRLKSYDPETIFKRKRVQGSIRESIMAGYPSIEVYHRGVAYVMINLQLFKVLLCIITKSSPSF